MKKQIDAKKTVLYIIALNLSQIVIMIAAFGYTLWHTDVIISAEWRMMLALFVFAAVSAAVTIASIFPMLRMIDERYSIGRILAETEKLNLTLRAQRHDFLNQLQVVYGLIELGDHAAANAYIEKVYDDIQKVSSVLKTDHAALNAILEAKANMCRARNIDIRLEVSSRFTDLAMPVWQLCRIFSNIIDNAVTAVSSGESDNKSITVVLSETVKGYAFRISNNGPAIPYDLWTHIFEPGFTTKTESGHGMGLAICRELLEEYGGELKVRSTLTETSFDGFLPRLTDTVQT